MIAPNFSRHLPAQKEYILDHLHHYQYNFRDRFTALENDFPDFFKNPSTNSADSNDSTDYFYLFCLWIAHQLSLAKYDLPLLEQDLIYREIPHFYQNIKI